VGFPPPQGAGHVKGNPDRLRPGSSLNPLCACPRLHCGCTSHLTTMRVERRIAPRHARPHASVYKTSPEAPVGGPCARVHSFLASLDYSAIHWGL
jgi:hypothetical protein